MFTYLKSIPETDWKENKGMTKFTSDSRLFKAKYKLDQRKIILNEQEKLKLIKFQKNESNISGALIFLGDDIEVDHEFPISKGGKDEIYNLKIVHKDENREKGTRT